MGCALFVNEIWFGNQFSEKTAFHHDRIPISESCVDNKTAPGLKIENEFLKKIYEAAFIPFHQMKVIDIYWFE